MRLIVFFDLPTITPKNKKDYQNFRKFLIKSGYIMMQNSVYSKLIISEASSEYALNDLKKHKPPKGLIQVLKISEKQFSNIIDIIGSANSQEFITQAEEFLLI